MAKPKGMLSVAALSEAVGNGALDTVLVVFTDIYGRLIGKRFDAEFFVEQIVNTGTHACDYLLTVDMEMEPVAGYRFSNWERGYGDFHLVPDLATLRIASWLDRTAMVLCDVHNEATHNLLDLAPRSLLKEQIERSAAAGFDAKAGSELEYFIFENSYREAATGGYANLQPAGWYIEDYHALQGAREEPFNGEVRRHLAASGVPVECTKGEWGKGQHELNVRYCDVLGMADNHGIYKQCVKEIADRQGISVTFMAKYSHDHAGSSCHVHLSLWKNGVNAFAGKQDFSGIACSDEFRWFLAGWMEHTPELMAFYAPTINSYKRYQSGSWAPTRIAWCRDNRTAGFRVVGQGASLRIECRIPGADCNPYMVYAAALASGLDGIANKTEPPPIFEGDVYNAENLPKVPRTLRQATDNFEQSDFAKSAFGADVVEHYTHFFRTEIDAYDRAVTDWERQRYFERI